MTLQKVKMLLAIARDKSAIYIKGEGAFCPVCLFLRLPMKRVACYKSDGSVRYHACQECGTNFKSVEIKPYLDPVSDIGTLPKTNDKSKKKPHIKNRRS